MLVSDVTKDVVVDAKSIRVPKVSMGGVDLTGSTSGTFTVTAVSAQLPGLVGVGSQSLLSTSGTLNVLGGPFRSDQGYLVGSNAITGTTQGMTLTGSGNLTVTGYTQLKVDSTVALGAVDKISSVGGVMELNSADLTFTDHIPRLQGTINTGFQYATSGFFGIGSTGSFTVRDSAGSLGAVSVNTVSTNSISAFTLLGQLSAGSNAITGTNFQVNGGSINSTPIGSTTPSTGVFTNISSAVSSNTPERLTCNSSVPVVNPSTAFSVTFITVVGVTFTGTGTLASGTIDGQVKLVSCTLGTNCVFRLTVLLDSVSRILTFKSSGQSIQFIWNAVLGTWSGVNAGVY